MDIYEKIHHMAMKNYNNCRKINKKNIEKCLVRYVKHGKIL